MRCRLPLEEIVVSVVLSPETYCVLTTRSGGGGGGVGFGAGGAGLGAAGFAGAFGTGRGGCCAAATVAATQHEAMTRNSLRNALLEGVHFGRRDGHLDDSWIGTALRVAIGPDSPGTSGCRNLSGLLVRAGGLGQRV